MSMQGVATWASTEPGRSRTRQERGCLGSALLRRPCRRQRRSHRSRGRDGLRVPRHRRRPDHEFPPWPGGRLPGVRNRLGDRHGHLEPVLEFQEAGINMTGPGTTVNATGNRVEGRGPIDTLSQNRMRSSSGHTEACSTDTVSEVKEIKHHYSQGIKERAGIRVLYRLLKNAHLRRFSRPSSLRHTSKYASRLGISRALHLGIFEQPVIKESLRAEPREAWQSTLLNHGLLDPLSPGGRGQG